MLLEKMRAHFFHKVIGILNYRNYIQNYFISRLKTLTMHIAILKQLRLFLGDVFKATDK